jgi:hypothetical protein
MNQQIQSKYYIRFVLEVLALVGIGWWGAGLFSGWLAILSGAFFVTLTMLVWGVFNVLNDPSRSGKAPIRVPGKVRLAIEIVVFLFGTFALSHIEIWYGIFYFIVVIAHYIHTKERVKWLLKQ